MKAFKLLLVLLLWHTSSSAAPTHADYFEACGVQGSTTLYDYKHKHWHFTDRTDAYQASLPASTFKIINSLIALDTGAIKNTHEIIKWDGKDNKLFGQSIPAWNRDQDLVSAYKNSTIWFYVELAKRIGRKNYQRYLDQADYGNGNLSEEGTDFWNYGEFGIAPIDQVHFLIRLYENTLPFSQAAMDSVKDIMVSENTQGITYRDKTGWTQKNGRDIGWWVGYAQAQNNVYFFATRITKDVHTKNANFAACRKTITKHVLESLMHP